MTACRTLGLRRAVCMMGVCLFLTGCAGLTGGGLAQKDAQPAFSNPALSMPKAQALVINGASSKANVLALLGAATVVKFDSAYEVWVYRGRSAGPQTIAGPGAELVILFDATGIAVKSRLRPPDGPAPLNSAR